LNFDYIITAHHNQDNIETFFINSFRGTGLLGLNGIPNKRNNILRPLLLVNKKEKGKRGQVIDEWIKLNHPDNGLFRVYWKNVIASNIGDVTLDPNDGEELRYEWYYKDGKRADGISKGWWPNGKLKHKWCWKNNLRDGLWIFYDENGQKKSEEIYKDGKLDGLWTFWYENGQKEVEGTYKDGKKDGLGIYWYDNGQKQAEGTFNNGKEDGLWTYWSSDGNDFAN